MHIYGVINKVQSYSTQTVKGSLKIYDLKLDKKLTVYYNSFLPVHNLDSIKGEIDKDNTFISKPLVVPVETKEYLEQSLYSSLKNSKFGYKKCNDFIDELLEYSGDMSNVYKNINSWSVDNSKRNFLTTILNNAQIEKFLAWWKKNYTLRKLYLLGLNDKEINYAFLNYDEIYLKLKNNPYNLHSISIDKAKDINSLLEKENSKYDILGGNIIRFIYNSGWTCMPLKYIYKAFPEIHTGIEYIQKKFNLIFVDKYVYNEYCYRVETYLLNKLKTMILKNDNEKLLNLDMPKAVNNIILDKDIILTKEQIAALEGSLDNHVSVISGGAGCGKTTLIKNIIKNLEYRKIKYVLTSFTGKAVLRIKEVLGNKYSKHCYTLSLLIGKKKHNAGAPPFDTLIIDEASMVSGSLIYEFFNLYKHYFKIILVGDVNQLPPIGVINFFKEVIISKTVPVYYLTINKRILEDVKSSNILINANLLLKDSFSEFKTGNGFEIIYADKIIIKSIIGALYKRNIKMESITVLTPYNKHIEDINRYARNIYLKDNDLFVYDNKKYIIGDRVMQVVNVYGDNEDVMNGEEGIIKDIQKEKLVIDFGDGKIIDYKWCVNKKTVKKEDIGMEKSEKDFYSCDLKHSFCKTVHKSQGSEYLYVIFYLPENINKSNFVNINLLYTAVTRTKKTFWFVGDRLSLKQALSNKLRDNFDRLSIRLNKL